MSNDRERKRRYHDVEPQQGSPFSSSPGGPLPYVVVGFEHTTAIHLNAGQTVLIDSDGLVRNEYGTILFKLRRA